MAKIYLDKHKSFDAKPLAVGKVSMLTVLMFIVLFVVGSLMFGGFFSTGEKIVAPVGNENTGIRP